MCVIICGFDQKPTLSELLQCESRNPDGGGVAWVESGKVRWMKGITAKEVSEVIHAEHAPNIWAAHFRIKTVGGKHGSLCHPFPIVKDPDSSLNGTDRRVLFHNGHWGDWAKSVLKLALRKPSLPVPDGPWSDSRAAAWIIANGDMGSRFLSTITSKFVILDAKRGLLSWPNPKEWCRRNGVFYSNLLWSFGGGIRTAGKAEEEEWDALYEGYDSRGRRCL